jgi:2-pyrone-4,6-dicarboxylate lactonase
MPVWRGLGIPTRQAGSSRRPARWTPTATSSARRRVFPYAPEPQVHALRRGKDQLFALRDHLGFSRNVIVQATCHGADNRALLDAIAHSDGRARGVATVEAGRQPRELKRLHDGGRARRAVQLRQAAGRLSPATS